MKTFLYSIYILLSLTFAVNVQAQRRLPDQQGLQATIGPVDGFSKKSVHVGVALSRFTTNSNQWVFGVEYLRKNLQYREQSVPVEQFTGEGGFYLTVLSDRSKTLFFSVGLSGMAGYELVNRDRNLLYDGAAVLSQSKFLYGGALTFEVETWLADRIVLLTGFRQRVLPGSTVNRCHNQLLIGFMFIIN